MRESAVRARVANETKKGQRTILATTTPVLYHECFDVVPSVAKLVVVLSSVLV